MGEIGEHYRNLREHRKRRRAEKEQTTNNKKKTTEEAPRRRCWDWMIVSEYRRVGKDVSTGWIQGMTTYVAGVGTVELKVQPKLEEGSPFRTLVLENVLHIPGAVCNGFSVAVYHTIHGGIARTGRTAEGTDEDGYPLWCSEDFKGLKKLVLAGNPQGESYLDDGPKVLSVNIDMDEIMSPGS
ncbi:conserved hypothetical protein [Talaromyces stipitatus ATCC 10500]|uniref:Uncharacterized protein n=1 Tax=Talaromyces stipitatus (strain ATCC 10500 / CBS 375.48 / QM 6759 / NRRL 1006) TaxID=441959 RepID=B8LXW2_TALSN|nr:uncharacterized protein TSTA_062640 [Talaromyces stipitatus ATCC 10500]EED22777.1 conserved hypothetical protein [Talaromyces stipitatus ATCC 10500]